MTLRDKIQNLRSEDSNESDSERSLKRRLRQDVRAADRTTSKATDELKRRVRNDVRTAGRRARNVDSQDVRRAVRRAGETVDGVEASTAGTSKNDPTAEAAEDAATMGAPMMASLEPTTSPHDMHNFASGGLAVDQQVTSDSEPPADDSGIGFDVAFGGGGRDRDAGSERADDLGFGFDVDVGGMAMDDEDGPGLSFDDDERWF